MGRSAGAVVDLEAVFVEIEDRVAELVANCRLDDRRAVDRRADGMDGERREHVAARPDHDLRCAAVRETQGLEEMDMSGEDQRGGERRSVSYRCLKRLVDRDRRSRKTSVEPP